jgi:hypothetical protein
MEVTMMRLRRLSFTFSIVLLALGGCHSTTPDTAPKISAERALISVECRVMVLDDQTLKAVQEIVRTKENKETPIESAVIDAKQLSEFIRTVQANKEASNISAPRVTMFSGDRCTIEFSGNISYVAGIEKNFRPDVKIALSAVAEPHSEKVAIAASFKAKAAKAMETITMGAAAIVSSSDTCVVFGDKMIGEAEAKNIEDVHLLTKKAGTVVLLLRSKIVEPTAISSN